MKKTIDVADPVVDETTDESAVATTDGGGMLPQTPMALGATVSDDTEEKMSIPILKIAHGVGNLAEDYSPGDLVLDEEALLAHKGEPLKWIYIGAMKYWKEYLKYDPSGETRPREFFTKKEVLENGGTVTWNKQTGEGPSFRRAMRLDMLIQQPEGIISHHFGVEIGDKVYAPARMFVEKGSYNNVAPKLKSAEDFSLRKRGLSSGLFELSTKSITYNTGNKSFVPQVRLIGSLTDEEFEELKTLFPPQED